MSDIPDFSHPPIIRSAGPGAAPSPAFLGRGWAFPPRFDPVSHRVAMASGDEDVRESLIILLSTQIGERVMLATYGCDLMSLVFSTLTTTTANEMAAMITRAIVEWEPRVDVEAVEVSDSLLDGWVAISLDYVVRQTNTRSNLVFPYYQLEATLPPPQG